MQQASLVFTFFLSLSYIFLFFLSKRKEAPSLLFGWLFFGLFVYLGDEDIEQGLIAEDLPLLPLPPEDLESKCAPPCLVHVVHGMGPRA